MLARRSIGPWTGESASGRARAGPHQPSAAEACSARRTGPHAPHDAGVLVGLQATAGKRAVVRLVVQRDTPADASCPKVRPPGEREQSRSPEGILAVDVTFLEADRTLIVQDFPVNGTTLPAGLTTSSGWQRAMSLIIGDRTSGAF